MSIILNACLVPEARYADKLVWLSSVIASRDESRFVLGEASVPHATVVQFETTSEPEKIIRTLEPMRVRRGIELTAAGLALLPTPEGDVWQEVAILKKRMLADLQAEILRILGGEIKAVINGVDDMYRPHFTVGLTKMQAAGYALSELPHEVLRAADISCTLHVGLTGDSYQVTRLLS